MTLDLLRKQSVLLILPAQNFNETEYLVVSESLRKAGIKTFIASDAVSLCVGSGGLRVKADVSFFNIHEGNFGGAIIIGGSGTREYWNNPAVRSIVKKFSAGGKTIGAICSAPVILAKAGAISEYATCYPDDRKELERSGIEYRDNPVVVNGNVITAQNPAASTEFVARFVHGFLKS